MFYGIACQGSIDSHMARVSFTFVFSIITLFCMICSSQLSVMAQESSNSTIDEDSLVRFTLSEEFLEGTYSKTESLNWDYYGPGISAGDFDNDGDMDVYVSARFSHLEWEDSHNSWSTSFGNQLLFENKGNFKFVDVTEKAGLNDDFNGDGISDSTSLSGVWGDYDSDGFLDLYVSEFGHTNGKYQGGRENILYHNNGDGTFTDVTKTAGVGNSGRSTVAQWVDYDHDGDLDLYSLNYGFYELKETTAQGETNILYQNNGDGTFSDVTLKARLSGSSYYSEILGEPYQTDLLRADLAAGTSSSPGIYSDSAAGSGMSWAALWFDSNGDGIGDFEGLLQKLDYLEDLGVTAIWLLPFYPSPLRDDGYDIADYYSINPSYGEIEDFKRFIEEAHKRGLKVITELVINHTSDQHEWFQRARKAPAGSKYRDYYVWTDDVEKYKDARIIFTDTEPSNWTWDAEAGAYYWHRFFSHQPDLNFDNPDVQQEVFNIMDYWCELGVDGFRLDAVPYLFERDGTNCENLPETHVFLKKLRQKHYLMM